MRQLTAAFVRTVTVPGKYGDQHGLILRVTASGSKQWIWRGTIRGKRRDLGLGGYPYTSLAEARQRAFEYRKLARSGGDPTALRPDTTAPSFAEACEQVIAMHEPSWKDGGRSAGSWRSILSRFAYPRLGNTLRRRDHLRGRARRGGAGLADTPGDRTQTQRPHQRRHGVGHRRRPPIRRPDRRGDTGAAPQRPPSATPPGTPPR